MTVQCLGLQEPWTITVPFDTVSIHWQPLLNHKVTPNSHETFFKLWLWDSSVQEQIYSNIKYKVGLNKLLFSTQQCSACALQYTYIQCVWLLTAKSIFSYFSKSSNQFLCTSLHIEQQCLKLLYILKYWRQKTNSPNTFHWQWRVKYSIRDKMDVFSSINMSFRGLLQLMVLWFYCNSSVQHLRLNMLNQVLYNNMYCNLNTQNISVRLYPHHLAVPITVSLRNYSCIMKNCLPHFNHPRDQTVAAATRVNKQFKIDLYT